MDGVLTNNGQSIALNDLRLKLETIVPSKLKMPSGDRTRFGPVSNNTVRGLENRKSVMEHSFPDGWTRVKHPDLGLYYVHEDKGLCTLSNMLDPKICSTIMEGADVLQRSAAWQVLLEDQKNGMDLVLDVQGQTSYYCVSHAERRIFWLEGFGYSQVTVPCPSIKCKDKETSKGHCIEGQYWKHCELFPTTLAVTKGLTGELKDVLLQAAADRLLVKFSTSPYGKHDLEYMLDLVKDIEAGEIRKWSGHAAWIIARFMALYNDGVLQSSYGQPDDYFDIDDTRKIPPYERPLLLALLAPFFLMSPDVYAEELHSFHENFTLDRWSKFVHKVDQSIRDSNLLATVLLSTNVGMLAWSDGGRVGLINSPTAAQIVTYISIICSVGSIITGLAIFKQYRAKGADTPLRAVVVLRRILKKPFGLESLAIICSLPYVLLMWGLIAFLGSFGIIFYEHTGIRVRIPVTLMLFIVILGLCFCIYAAAVPPDKDDPKQQRQSTIIAPPSSQV